MDEKSIKEQVKILTKNSVSFVSEPELEKKLSLGRPLRIKLGVDPSRPDLHLGHAVVLKKLKKFQNFGHKVVLIIGDFTARIGDPTGKSKTRPMLTKLEAEENAQTYIKQATKILSGDQTEIRFNSEWLDKMNFEDVIRLASKYTVARILERNDFSQRYKNNETISIAEFLYPLAQAMDSVEIKSDVEIGGDDQFFNLLVGRKIQEEYGLSPQCVLTFPLIEGTDGNLKMSKSYDNYIAFEDTNIDMFGKLMSIPDKLIVKYMELLTDCYPEEIKEVVEQLKNKKVNPRDIKLKLACDITSEFHGKEKAEEAYNNFINVFQKKNIPEEMPEIKIHENNLDIITIMNKYLNIKSRSEARRLISQNAVKYNNNIVTDPFMEIEVKKGDFFRIGKKKFYKVIV
ncbi:MAG: tyrosyl-tRNA synthetase [Kosmotogales bacterium]|nr:tyrosyl-tRNA synthetase [Kosmotogales bacterium]